MRRRWRTGCPTDERRRQMELKPPDARRQCGIAHQFRGRGRAATMVFAPRGLAEAPRCRGGRTRKQVDETVAEFADDESVFYGGADAATTAPPEGSCRQRRDFFLVVGLDFIVVVTGNPPWPSRPQRHRRTGPSPSRRHHSSPTRPQSLSLWSTRWPTRRHRRCRTLLDDLVVVTVHSSVGYPRFH